MDHLSVEVRRSRGVGLGNLLCSSSLRRLLILETSSHLSTSPLRYKHDFPRQDLEFGCVGLNLRSGGNSEWGSGRSKVGGEGARRGGELLGAL